MSDAGPAHSVARIAASPPPSAPIETTKRNRIRGKLKLALDAMVWGFEQDKPLPWNEAAKRAEFTTVAMREALEKAHVQAYLRAQRQVLRSSICAGNLSRLAEIRDQNSNLNAAVSAVKVLEQMDDPEHARGPAAPFGGVVVVIQAPSVMGHQTQIEAKPLNMKEIGGNNE